VCTCERVLPSYEHLDGQIRQKYARSETDRVQNGEMRRNGYVNGKKRMDWVLLSRD